mmetsp:Transcript_17335/g.35144  ORF Transcript_17335/g.35144 Transcript_17335/m.35144 type:complete len:244 (+) Transcript_17335:316-1047(+)
MMGGHLYMVQLAQRSEFPAFRKPAVHRAVELQDLDRLLLDHCPATVARDLTFPAGNRDACLLRQQLDASPVVLPAHRLLQPSRPQRFQQANPLHGGAEVPRAVDVDHEVLVIAKNFTDVSQAVNVLEQCESPRFDLESDVSLVLHHLQFIPQFRVVFAIPVIAACRVNRHFVPVPSKQSIQGQIGTFAHDVPTRKVNRRAAANHCFAGPALLARRPAGREAEQSLVQPLRGQGVLANDEIGKA